MVELPKQFSNIYTQFITEFHQKFKSSPVFKIIMFKLHQKLLQAENFGLLEDHIRKIEINEFKVDITQRLNF